MLDYSDNLTNQKNVEISKKCKIFQKNVKFLKKC